MRKTLQIDVDITRFDNFYRIVLKLITIIINIVIRNITCCDNESVHPLCVHCLNRGKQEQIVDNMVINYDLIVSIRNVTQ